MIDTLQTNNPRVKKSPLYIKLSLTLFSLFISYLPLYSPQPLVDGGILDLSGSGSHD